MLHAAPARSQGNMAHAVYRFCSRTRRGPDLKRVTPDPARRQEDGRKRRVDECDGIKREFSSGSEPGGVSKPC